MLERVQEFRSWAADQGCSIDSCFPTESIDSVRTGETYTRITLSTMTLAKHERGSLRFGSPYIDGETVHTISDRIDALEASATETRSDEAGENHSSRPGGRP